VRERIIVVSKNMKNTMRFCSWASAIAFCVFCIIPNTALSETRTKPIPEKELERYQYCGEDSHCMAVQNGCCDCANGGKDIAIARDAEKDFKARFDCGRAACTLMASIPPCGSGVVSCVNHRCHYFTHKEVEKSEANLDPKSPLEPADINN
jgi:hypothetical protein